MRIGVLVLGFGEPEEATVEAVVPFLERIFTQNAALEGDLTPERVRARSRELAEARAPGLVEEYRAIGGSPLNAQARSQTAMLEAELRSRGQDAACYTAMQFTEPFIADAVVRARDEGAEMLVGLPVYPLCGRSTTVASLEDVRAAVEGLGWDVLVREVTGWHRHPDYVRLHGDTVREFAARRGLELHDPGTRLVFSAHGTPVKYREEGPRYEHYVTEWCELLARDLGVEGYALGYQNHTNRPIEWTSPDIEDVVAGLEGRRAVVVAVSFMHEQSETLAELDRDLRGEAEAVGLDFHRVPIPHDDPRFGSVLADLVEGVVRDVPVLGPLALKRCLCRPTPETWCLNAVSG